VSGGPGGAAGRQLALPFAAAPDYAGAEFFAAPSNAAARAWLARTADWPGGRLLLWGEAGCGKTHLLHRWAARRGAPLIQGEALRGLPAPPPAAGIAIDDADNMGEEAALLHLLNAAAERGAPALLSARTPPARWAIRLPDLASRLRATAAVEIGRAEDSLLRALFARLLADRQMVVAEPVQEWLLLRLPRTPAALRAAAARLDRVALAAGRPVTRALAAVALADLCGGGDEAADDELLARSPSPASPPDLRFL
jgi:chromosomal replication initiation ATPase DnaA